MKKIFVTLLSGVVLLLLPNCGNNNSTPPTGATTMNAQCGTSQYGVASQPCAYFPYSNYQGFSNSTSSSYGYTGYMGSTGSCGTSPLTNQPMYPAYSASKGMGCVDMTYAGYVGTPVYYALQGTAYVPVGNQYGSTFRACDANDPCAGTNRCLAPFPASTGVNSNGLGICFN